MLLLRGKGNSEGGAGHPTEAVDELVIVVDVCCNCGRNGFLWEGDDDEGDDVATLGDTIS